MIIIKQSGGLGNQMFQYALGKNLSIKNNIPLILDIGEYKKIKSRTYDLNNFNVEKRFISLDNLITNNLPISFIINKHYKKMQLLFLYQRNFKYIAESSPDFDCEILDFKKNAYLDGFWQSEKYFLEIKNILVNEFSLSCNPNSINKYYLDIIQKSESISIHIRRGDYISNPKTHKIHGFLGSDYYYKAINIMLEKIDNPHFFIFSDDINWAEANIIINAPTLYIKHNSNNNHEDFRLMKTCKHHIISNSSFSWWGAWLASNESKIVIGPSKWFSSLKYSDKSRMPADWIRI